jgi:hypothetical protein
MLLADASQKFGVPYMLLYRAVLSGELRAERANKKSWSVTPDAVEQWLAASPNVTSRAKKPISQDTLKQVAIICRLWGKIGSLRATADMLQMSHATLQSYANGRSAAPTELVEKIQLLLVQS